MISGIVNNLSLPLNTANENAWINAFGELKLLKYRSAFVTTKTDHAVKQMHARSREFKIALIELLNSDYPKQYAAAVKMIFKKAGKDAKLRAISANYILPGASPADIKFMQEQVALLLKSDPEDARLYSLQMQLQTEGKVISMPSLRSFFSADYLPGQVLVFSFQRRDRNYPGLAMVRKADGSFLQEPGGSYFSVGQLARSESNMPGYISMGNTPQGIFRMDGFDTSKSNFIGTTTNIQLTMPFEFKATHFYQNNLLRDSVWTPAEYANLLPPDLRQFQPLYGTYYAGKAGRNEIIAHGTTIDPSFYKDKTYFPYSPSAGCLVCKETWDDKGYLASSDQFLLTQAVKAAGGPKGYLILIEIDDKKSAVTFKDISAYLPKMNNKESIKQKNAGP